MGKQNFSKIKLLKIWEMLKQDTDEQHPLTTNQIIEKLKAVGIECDRKTLYQDIATLNTYGYEIIQRRGQHNNSYYVIDRNFDVPELRILMDAVQAASFVTEKKTAEFIDKISALGGSNRAELLKRNIVLFNTTKHTNENIYYSVDKIDEAILSEKKIIFKYFDYDLHGERVFRRDGHRYVANPVTLVFSNDNYYLVCYHDNHKMLTNYRVDRMTEVDMLDAPINKEARPKGIDISDSRKQAFSMFSGETQKVTFEMTSDLIDVIFDKFGEKTKIADLGDNKIQFSADVQISNMFFGWCCSFGDKLKIVAPSKIKEELHAYIQALVDSYSGGNI